jgi:hypothetical protein
MRAAIRILCERLAPRLSIIWRDGPRKGRAAFERSDFQAPPALNIINTDIFSETLKGCFGVEAEFASKSSGIPRVPDQLFKRP